MSRELQKLEALLAHYYLKLERSFILNSIDNKIVLTEGTISSPLGVGERSLVRVTVQTDKNLPKFLFFFLKKSIYTYNSHFEPKRSRFEPHSGPGDICISFRTIYGKKFVLFHERFQ